MDSNINRISFELSADDQQAVKDAIQVIEDKLMPHLIALNVSDRRSLYKMGKAAIPFVSKAGEYARQDLNRPVYLDVDEMQRDLSAVEQLADIARSINRINSNLDDSIMAAGAEAYAAALTYYHSVKAAAKARVPGAQAIYEDLYATIPARGGSKKSAEPTEQTA